MLSACVVQSQDNASQTGYQMPQNQSPRNQQALGLDVVKAEMTDAPKPRSSFQKCCLSTDSGRSRPPWALGEAAFRTQRPSLRLTNSCIQGHKAPL